MNEANKPSHRQEREHKKEEHAHSTPPRHPRTHLTWFMMAGIILIGLAVLIWTFLI